MEPECRSCTGTDSLLRLWRATGTNKSAAIAILLFMGPVQQPPLPVLRFRRFMTHDVVSTASLNHELTMQTKAITATRETVLQA